VACRGCRRVCAGRRHHAGIGVVFAAACCCASQRSCRPPGPAWAFRARRGADPGLGCLARHRQLADARVWHGNVRWHDRRRCRRKRCGRTAAGSSRCGASRGPDSGAPRRYCCTCTARSPACTRYHLTRHCGPRPATWRSSPSARAHLVWALPCCSLTPRKRHRLTQAVPADSRSAYRSCPWPHADSGTTSAASPTRWPAGWTSPWRAAAPNRFTILCQHDSPGPRSRGVARHRISRQRAASSAFRTSASATARARPPRASRPGLPNRPPRRIRQVPPVWNIPNRNADFTGRAVILDQLRGELVPHQATFARSMMRRSRSS
jgi:hypothetical protein